VRTYETTFIVNPQSDDATIDRQVSAVTDIITGNGGEIVREERMGTRRLAYPIAGLTQGFFATIYFKSTPAVLPLLDRHYKLEEPYVRYLTIIFEADFEALDKAREEQRAGRFGGQRSDRGGPRRRDDGPSRDSRRDAPARPAVKAEEKAEEKEAPVKAEEPAAEAAAEPVVDAPVEAKPAAKVEEPKAPEAPKEEEL